MAFSWKNAKKDGWGDEAGDFGGEAGKRRDISGERGSDQLRDYVTAYSPRWKARSGTAMPVADGGPSRIICLTID